MARSRELAPTPFATKQSVARSTSSQKVWGRAAVISFRRAVMRHYRAQGRHALPWRKIVEGSLPAGRQAYKILVSEMMLQQTQVSRVIPYYKRFLREFPTVRALARAPLADVLRVWSGLGYNRRAKFLHDAAKEIVAKYGGRVPSDAAALRALPGTGDYTAKAIRVFAWNEPEILIETNVRTAVIHHFFHRNVRVTNSNIRKVSDKELLPYMGVAAEGQSPREWNWALMDYGAHLKAVGVRVNARSAHYAKQSKFEGSLRQVRGAILKALTQRTPMHEVEREYKDRFQKAFNSLVRDGLVEVQK